MRRIKSVSRAPFAGPIPAAAIREMEPWEYWLACLISPLSWIIGIKGCYCSYSHDWTQET